MKNNLSFAGIFALAVAMLFIATGCPDEDPNLNTTFKGAAPYRILSVGASFTRDAMTYLRDMLIANGVADNDIDIVNGYVGGQTLAKHVISLKFDMPTYERQSFGKKGSMSIINNARLSEIIASNNWDYISIQQGADQAGNLDAYNDEDIDFLLNYVKENCPNPDVIIAFHQTWAYAANTTQSVFNTLYGGNQLSMYNIIMETVQDKILPRVNDPEGVFDFIIPSGTAIQNARTVFGDTLNSDGYHLNDKGRFIAGAMWLKQIYGKSVNVFDSPYKALNGYTISLEDIGIIAQCVQDAFDHPFQITEQQ